MDRYIVRVFFLAALSVASGQLTTRQCSANNTVINSRCAVTSGLQAASTCTTYCASTTQSSTALYTKYCASTSSCTVGSACNIESCTIDISGPGSVEVPCNNGGVNIANLTLTNGCATSTTSNYVTTDLVYSTNPTDGRHFIDVDPTTGSILTSGTNVVPENVTQVYEFTFSSVPNLEVSRSINITFHFGTCILGLTGPSSAVVCAGYPPGGSIFTPNTPLYDAYPQLTFAVTNAPPLLDLIWDLPSDQGGLGATAADNLGIFSPTVVSGDEPAVFVSNMNVVAGSSSTSTIGIYGAGNNGALPCGGITNAITGTDPVTGDVTGNCCQTLLFSVSPGVTVTPYFAASKQVKVCYDNTDTCSLA